MPDISFFKSRIQAMEIQPMKTSLRVFIFFTVMALSVPCSLQARELSIDQVKQNVINLYKSAMEAQPAVSAKNFKKIIDGDSEFVLLDVRSEAEFNAAHLPGALNVERGRIEWVVPNIIKKTDRAIYVYCQDGRRSGFAAERLIQMGYTNTIHISDGFEGWVTAGYYVYNIHGEFMLSTGGYYKREPMVGNISK
jgi:rhodanese-related sulfurtransferase